MKTLISFLIFISFYSCKNTTTKNQTFIGEGKAVLLADQMFKSIGGKDKWCELQSLYIKAKHTEPQMDIPYQSEIWRAIDHFEMVIEQQNDSFHVKAVVDDNAGIVRYYDKRDTVRVFSKTELEEWRFDHNHNIYVLLHDLACMSNNYKVELDSIGALRFYKENTFVVSFELDQEFRPHLFYVPTPDESSVNGSRFTHWGEHQGLVHSAGGHPLDSNFMYRTEIWEPGFIPMNEMFKDSVFMLE